jgi:hypothetical protein
MTSWEIRARLDHGAAVPAHELALHPDHVNGPAHLADLLGFRRRLVRLGLAHLAKIIHHAPTQTLASAAAVAVARISIKEWRAARLAAHPAIALKAAMATMVPAPKATR